MEKWVLVTGDSEATEMRFPVSQTGGETDMNTSSWCMRLDVKSTGVRGLNLRETQKRDIIPTGVSRGGSMDKVASCSASAGWRGFLQMEGRGKWHSQKRGKEEQGSLKNHCSPRMTSIGRERVELKAWAKVEFEGNLVENESSSGNPN